MANRGNRNRCRIATDWIGEAQLLRLNLSVLSSCGIPAVCVCTWGQPPKKHTEKSLRLSMNFTLGIYSGTNKGVKALHEVLDLAINSEETTMVI